MVEVGLGALTMVMVMVRCWWLLGVTMVVMEITLVTRGVVVVIAKVVVVVAVGVVGV